MSKTDPSRERSSALRRSRVARQGIVLSAVAGSLGIAGVLGLSAAVTQGAPPPSGTTTSQGNTGGGDNRAGTPTQVHVNQGDDGGERESDDGGTWVPARPSPNFNTGSNNSGGTAASGQAPAPKPHATTSGSVVMP